MRLQREVPAAARVGRRQLLQRAHAARSGSAPPRAAAADDVEAHDRLRVRRLAEVFCRTSSEPGLKLRKSTSSSIALGRMQRHGRALDRALEQAAVARDLHHLAAVAEPQLVGARVGGVEEPQPVDPALDRHPRRDRAVDEDRVAAEAEVDVLRVAERAVLVERVVGDDERHVVLALRAGRARARARRRAGRCRRGRSRASAPCGRARGRGTRGTPRPGRSGTSSRTSARRDDVHRVPVVRGGHVAAVQVDVGVERQPVVLAHDRRPALAGADRRARVDARRSRRSASGSRAGSRPGPRGCPRRRRRRPCSA